MNALNGFRIVLVKDIAMLITALCLPPLYFLLRWRKGSIIMAVVSMLIMIIGHSYGVLICTGLAVVAAFMQLGIDIVYRQVYVDNGHWLLRLFGRTRPTPGVATPGVATRVPRPRIDS